MPSPTPEALNEEASTWMHRGMDLAALGTREALERALGCFDEAIARRKTLPLGEVPLYRYGLSAGWINRADALAALGRLDEAVRSYEAALELLETLPLDGDPRYPRRLAIARLNRGVALQRREGGGDLARAAGSFRAALAVLGRFPGIEDGAALEAGGWANLAGVLAAQGEAETAEAREAARRALGGPADAAQAARHVLCRLLVRDLARGAVPEGLVAEATDAAEAGLARARKEGQAARAGEFFRFGCRIYAAAQPRFLAEFLADHAGETSGAENAAAARAAIWTAVERLQAGGFGDPALAGRVGLLREAETRLNGEAGRADAGR